MSVKVEQNRGDVRLRGFFDRASVEEATAWIMAHAAQPGAELVRVDEAAGRVLAADVVASSDFPPADYVAADGYALRSSETVGAGNYNPLPFVLQNPGADLPTGSAALVHAGERLPAGADCVLPFESAHVTAGSLEVISSIAIGIGIEPRGAQVRAGAKLLSAGRLLLASDSGLLASLGVAHVSVVRRPRVRLVVCGPKGNEIHDANTPMLRSLIARDGSVVETVVLGAADRGAIADAIRKPGADAVVVVGRSGTGADDEAPLAIREVGELAIHGIAMRPGDSAGLGTVDGHVVVLLPGEPLACFCAYEMLARPLFRLLAGRGSQLPYRKRDVEVGRRIVSSVGIVDFCRVRSVEGKVEPVGSVDIGGLASVVRADGFVIVPSALEGYAPGTRVAVYLFENYKNEIAEINLRDRK